VVTPLFNNSPITGQPLNNTPNPFNFGLQPSTNTNTTPFGH
jgi:hypothetical protein